MCATIDMLTALQIITEDDFKINEMLHVYGVYLFDPVDPTPVRADECAFAEEVNARNPPASLVPRLHCVAFRRIEHLNPLVPEAINEEGMFDIHSGRSPAIVCKAVLEQSTDCANALQELLGKLLGGDALAAQYLTLHLIAAVYVITRYPLIADSCLSHGPNMLGRFTCNVAGFHDEHKPVMTKYLHLFIKLIANRTLD